MAGDDRMALRRRSLFTLFAGFISLALSACGGPSIAAKKSMNEMLAAGNLPNAAAYIEGAKEVEYGKHNAVLYHLDIGVVLHDAGKYKESDEHFDAAERRMEELYTKSVTQAAGTLVINDTTQEYSGEVFERALTNVFRALNYVLLGQPDEALVEARKVEVFLDEINRRRGGKNVYKDDAFARYLDSLLYEDAGKLDDARVSRSAALKAYQWYASKYGTPAPRFGLSWFETEDAGEIVFIHCNGVGPRKISKTFQVAWKDALAAVHSTKADTEDKAASQRVKNALAAGIAGNSVSVAYPEYVQDSFRIAASEVQAGDKSAQTLLMEDITAIAIADLKDRNLVVKTRAIARATTKFLLAKLVEKEARKNTSTGGKWLADLTSRATNAVAAATEVADTRGWTTVPAQIRMARLRAAPGTHEVTVVFKDAAGAVVSTHVFKDVSVKKGRRTYLAFRTAQ
ncbi:MAG: hypothetical protein HY922_08965 [Elusimicrobia bacterium]|nr:hypothetical protein [Elusimicrobiota bacterium]